MVEDNMNKVYWILVVVAVVVALTNFVANPAYEKIKQQQTQISDINYAAPSK